MSDFKDMPVLITGAEGFIGSHLCTRLVKEGARVSALVLPGADLSRLSGIEESLSIHPIDIREFDQVEELVAATRPQRIFHLAAITDVKRDWDSVSPVTAVNLGGTINLLRALSKVEYEICITTCTAEAYGGNPAPFREEMPLDPISPYSFSKAAATAFCRMAAASLGASVRILRLFLVYGPGQGEERFLPQLIRAAITGSPFRMTAGEQTREYTYIDDLVEGFLLAAEKGPGKGEVYNLGSGREISLKDLVAIVGNIAGKKVIRDSNILPYRENEIRRFVGDHGKAAEELDWRATTDLETGLKQTITSPYLCEGALSP
ncbi:MAG: GDP-mannose 4,6-dehydratase [Candidatus Auribacterota bacterium]|nr:GDP-mannose 4,6-dehydratase [Candidatus Auribacterota bacterium]